MTGNNDMSDDNIVLETRDLTKYYGGVHALEGANFILRNGEHVGIMGDNGAGKSTFVRQITGVEQPTRGGSFSTKTRFSFRVRLMRVKLALRRCSRRSRWPMTSTCRTISFWDVK